MSSGALALTTSQRGPKSQVKSKTSIGDFEDNRLVDFQSSLWHRTQFTGL